MRKARSRRQSTRLDRSSLPERAAQNTQPTGARAAPTYPMRQGAQRRFTPGGESSRVDELAQSLSDLEERDPFLGDVHARPGLGVAPLARVPVTDTEAPEPPHSRVVGVDARRGSWQVSELIFSNHHGDLPLDRYDSARALARDHRPQSIR